MAASTLTTLAFVLQKMYSDDKVGDLATRQHPLFKMIQKKEGFRGSSFDYAIKHGNGQGIGATYTGATTAVSAMQGKQLTMARKKKYGYCTIDGETINVTDNTKAAFLDAISSEIDGTLEEIGDDMAFDLFRAGNGIRGRISSISSSVVTLTNADDARNFKINMELGASGNPDASSPRTGTDHVIAVDEDAGTFEFDDETQITSLDTTAPADYLFRATCGNGANLEGLEAHFPLTAPTASDSFRGISRYGDTRRLAGVRVDDTTAPIEENAGLVATKIGQVGQTARVVIVNPLNFWKMARRLNARVTYDGGGNKATYGFEGIDVATGAGTLRVIADPDCQGDRGWVLNLDTLCIWHRRSLPHVIMDDGLRSLRISGEDSVEVRFRAWSNLLCTRPGANGVFSI